MSSSAFHYLPLILGIICLIISVLTIPSAHAQVDVNPIGSDSLDETSIIGHDPLLFQLQRPAGTPVAVRRAAYHAQRIARGRSPPYYSQRILGRLSDTTRSTQASFQPAAGSTPPGGLFWMRQPAGAGTAPATPIVPRGPAGMHMLSEWSAGQEAASRPLPPLWSLLQAPRRSRKSRRDEEFYGENR